MLCPHIPPGHRVRYSRNPDDAAPERVPGPDGRRRTDKPFRRSRIPRRNTFSRPVPESGSGPLFPVPPEAFPTLLFPARGCRFRPAQKKSSNCGTAPAPQVPAPDFCFAVRSIHKIEAHLHSAPQTMPSPFPSPVPRSYSLYSLFFSCTSSCACRTA